MRILISGASGFIGRHIGGALHSQGHQIFALSRRSRQLMAKKFPEWQWLEWDGETLGDWANHLPEMDAVINLAGAPINRLWTKKYRQQIRRSRIQSTRILVQAIQKTNARPAVFLQMSATGIYGDGGNKILDESSPAGQGFLAQVVQEWEKATTGLPASTRLVAMRTGVVLGKGGGFLRFMALPYHLFFGGYIGAGNQWISWIHIDDLVQIAQRFLFEEKFQGIYNLVAPEPHTMRSFCQTLGAVLRRPCWVRFPVQPLQWFGGSMVREMVLASQRVVPRRLVQEGILFQFPTLYLALSQIYRQKEREQIRRRAEGKV